jgi:DNA-binding MarR family transcriptional regulator
MNFLINKEHTFSLPDWVLRTDATIDGDSLSYLDMVERNTNEERRRERERIMMEEGKALWKTKKEEQHELDLRDQEEVSN